MSKKRDAARRARELFVRQYQGVLCTHSQDVPGYPFGSVVPFCMDRGGNPVILISRIAQHTKNIMADPRVSLIAMEGDADDVQAHGRVTCIADAKPVDAADEDTAERYYRYFPASRGYHKTHDFDFYRLEPRRVRFIAGFGDIHWVDAGSFTLQNPLSREQEAGAVEHMNEDHAPAVLHYCALAAFPVATGETPVMVGADAEGFHVRIGKRVHRFTFDEPVMDTAGLRERLVDLSRRNAGAPERYSHAAGGST